MVDTATCWYCNAQNPPEHRFCGFCGSSLVGLCTACGERYQLGSEWCNNCGADVAACSMLADSSQSETEERRWVTIVFADLSGFTGLAEASDPEDVRSMIDRCMRLLGGVVRRFGGSIQQIAGDGMLAVFGIPVAHEDDAERAVRAALEMRQCAEKRVGDFGGLSLRIGVNTGEVMFAPVGPRQRREQTVVGDVVNTAARLQTSAPSSSILVGEETWRATRSSIHYSPMEPFRVKNKSQPVFAWLATGCSLTPAERPVSSVPMVDREAEARLLGSLWQDVLATRHPHLVIVHGPAGIGKSRLCHEFGITVRRGRARFMRGRSLPYSEGTVYAAFAQIVKQAADIYDTDSPEGGLTKLRKRIAGLMRKPEVEKLTAHLAAIVGLETVDQVVDRQALFLSAVRFVEALALEQPTVFCFEDVHWSKPSLIDLIEFVAVGLRQAPALLLVTTRPTSNAQSRLEGSQAPRTTLALGALPEAAAGDLTMRLLIKAVRRSSVAEKLRVAAGGNPLFIEELAASLIHGAIDSTQDLPTNLKVLIAARLDSLPSEQRQVVLDASVIGATFWRGAVVTLGSHKDIDKILGLLENQDLIRRHNDSQLEGDIEFSFKHAVIREVAYGILSKSNRRKRHAAVANFIEGIPCARTAETIQLLAYHWQHSSNPPRAVDYLITAADQAGRGWAKQEAVTLYNEALELIPQGDPRRPRVALKRAVAFQGWLHQSLDLDPSAFSRLDD